MLYTENSKLPGIERSEVYLTSVVSTYPESDKIPGVEGAVQGVEKKLSRLKALAATPEI